MGTFIYSLFSSEKFCTTTENNITAHRVRRISLARRTAMEHLEGTLQTLHPVNRYCVGVEPNAKAGRQLSCRHDLRVADAWEGR